MINLFIIILIGISSFAVFGQDAQNLELSAPKHIRLEKDFVINKEGHGEIELIRASSIYCFMTLSTTTEIVTLNQGRVYNIIKVDMDYIPYRIRTFNTGNLNEYQNDYYHGYHVITLNIDSFLMPKVECRKTGPLNESSFTFDEVKVLLKNQFSFEMNH